MTRALRMTLEQLKRHVDRRLAKKADKSDLRRLERRMNARFAQMDAQTNSRFEQVDSRFERVDSRLKQLDSRIEHITSRFEFLDRKLDRLNRIVNGRIDGQGRILDEFQSRLTDLESHYG